MVPGLPSLVYMRIYEAFVEFLGFQAYPEFERFRALQQLQQFLAFEGFQTVQEFQGLQGFQSFEAVQSTLLHFWRSRSAIVLRKKTRNPRLLIGRCIFGISSFYSKPRIPKILKNSKDTINLRVLCVRKKLTNPRIPSVR
jgi:hypothetical protein